MCLGTHTPRAPRPPGCRVCAAPAPLPGGLLAGLPGALARLRRAGVMAGGGRGTLAPPPPRAPPSPRDPRLRPAGLDGWGWGGGRGCLGRRLLYCNSSTSKDHHGRFCRRPPQTCRTRASTAGPGARGWEGGAAGGGRGTLRRQRPLVAGPPGHRWWLDRRRWGGAASPQRAGGAPTGRRGRCPLLRRRMGPRRLAGRGPGECVLARASPPPPYYSPSPPPHTAAMMVEEPTCVSDEEGFPGEDCEDDELTRQVRARGSSSRGRLPPPPPCDLPPCRWWGLGGGARGAAARAGRPARSPTL